MQRKQGKNSSRYDDIIGLPHPVSKKHPPMSRQDRAAQFSPFSALTGHEAAIRETARLTGKKIELDEDSKEKLGEKLRLLALEKEPKTPVTVTYFVPDAKKSGGEYHSHTGFLRRIDEYRKVILFSDHTEIAIEEISEAESELFDGMDWLNL